MFHVADAALIRAAAYPHALTLPAWPDLTADQPKEWLKWLSQAWALPGFAAAITPAAPQLAGQIAHAVAGEPMAERRLRRLVEATVRYLLRWTTRATPFGTFAGVAPVEFGSHAAIRWGEEHYAATRPDEKFIAQHTALAERDLATLRTVAVVTNSRGYPRGDRDRWVLPCARADGGRVWDVEIDLTGPVWLAVQSAASPIMFGDLTARVAEILPAGTAAAEQLLAALVEAGVLLSAVRPPMTVTDPAAHLTRHRDLPDFGGQVAVDLRVDCSVTLPAAVVAEAREAASALVAVAPPPPGWTTYHASFLDRWGPGAAVPLREVLQILGFPAGYRGSPRRREPTMVTARDKTLAELAQQSALDGCAEVVLDDELIGRLRGDDDRPPIPHTELRFTLAAETSHDLDRGAFTLTVVSGARHAGVAAARFLHLLTPTELDRFRRVYASLPTALPGADTVQLSGPPLKTRLAAVARAPELLPVLPVGDFCPDPQLTVEDLSVAGDGQRLWLVSRTTGRPVEPLLLNCVLPAMQQPLAWFLAEIWTAWTAPCSRFDWGHARSLPFLPRVRRGRSILHPARWLLGQATLPARTASWPQWLQAWQPYRARHRLPREVLIGDDDVRIRLDLDEPAHLTVLRSHLDRRGHAVLTEVPGPSGWLDGRPAELLLTLTDTQPRRPCAARAAGTLQHRPGASPWLNAHLYGRCDDILAHLVKRHEDLPAGWWFLRYPDPAPHLRLRIPLQTTTFADAARDLAEWAEQLHAGAVLSDYALHTYRPETRHGTGPTRAAAEAVFAADSAAALQRLSGDRQAAAAAGMMAIADAFTGGKGSRWLAEHVPRRSGPRLKAAQLALARVPYGGDDLSAALVTYRSLSDRDGLDPDQVLADLLHLHHARMIGVDTASEQQCLRLARAVAHADLARRSS
ncbi:lantibiotic dehydratase [Actinoallomurus sp. NBC_01490]|uniref:lantibiotic dehydratase n=1 Tax=Actinoallomurus sp. NBC_01490 TaxID=2903557 RepID=UPI002E324B71|nr:lantibiotic dehydratase [Actinoallomurus sp. NBC_01490]